MTQTSHSGSPSIFVSLHRPCDAAPTQLVAIYEWRKARVVFAARVAAATLVLDCRFIQGRDLVTCGVNHVHFWWERGDTYYQEKGLLCRKTQPQPFLCVAAPGDKVVCGAASGHLLVWEGRTCAKTFKVHSGAVTCLYAVGEAQGAARPGLVSASTDGKVQMYWQSWSSLPSQAQGNSTPTTSTCCAARCGE